MYEDFKPSPASRVLVIGDVMLDRYLYGDTSRISPEAPVPIVKINNINDKPGGAANVAMNIKALGVDVQLLGITGVDDSAATLSSLLDEHKVEFNFIQQAGLSTITKLRIISRHQQLIRLDYEGNTEIADLTDLLDPFIEALKNTDVVILSDYAKGTIKNAQEFIDAAREKSVYVLVDPKGNDFTGYRNANVLTPNLKEFEMIVGECTDDEQIVEKALSLSHTLDIDAICITRGEDGMTLIKAEQGTVKHLPAQVHEVYDVTGAGDTAIAVMAAAISSGYKIEQAIEYANFAAGLVVQKLGTASVTEHELNTALVGIKQETASNIYDYDELSGVIHKSRSKGEIIVMTNGCFDILHAGHVDYLRKAKALGDRLLVAVNDDDSVKRLKGNKRPINSLMERMHVLAGLAAVDWIIPFSEDTPAELVKSIQPDVLVKGSDYQPHEIAGADTVVKHGGRIEIIPLVEGNSTTKIINAVREKE